MFAIGFTLSTVNVAPLEAAQERMEDLSPAMAAIADYMTGNARERINETNEAPDGTAWPPSQRAIATGTPTLLKSGRLFESITAAHDATSATVGTNVPYANIHNSGGTIRAQTRADGRRSALRTPFGPRASVKMPKRQFIGFSEADKIEIPQILADFLNGVAA